MIIMLNIIHSYPKLDNTRCAHNTRYTVGNPAKWKCVECSLSLLNDSRIPLINKYTAIDELCYAAENKLDFNNTLSCGHDTGPRLARVLIDFSLSNLVLEEYSKRLQDLVVSLLESPNSCHQRQYILSHLLMKINNIPLTRKQGPALCLFVELTERFSGSEFATNPSQISHLLDKLIYILLEPDPTIQNVILRGISSMLQHWSIGILSELQLTRLTSALVQIIDRSGSPSMYSQSFIILSTLLQQEQLRALLCRSLAAESCLKPCVEAVKKLVLSSETTWQTSGLHFLLELISLEETFLGFFLNSELAEYLLECGASSQQDSVLQLVLANLAVFCRASTYFSQMHHLFAVLPLCKILKFSIDSDCYHNVVKCVSILTGLFESGAERGPVISREEDLVTSLHQIKDAVGHHNPEIAITSSRLFTLILKQDLTASISEDTEVLLVSVFSQIQKRITTMDKSTPFIKQEFSSDSREVNSTFEEYFCATLHCELSALKVVFVREIKQVLKSDSHRKQLKECVLVFYEQFILPTYQELIHQLSPMVTTQFCYITLELVSNIPHSLQLVTRLVESSLIQNLWNTRLRRNEEKMDTSVNNLVKKFCCVLIQDQEESMMVSEYIDSFLALRICITFNDVTKFMLEHVTAGRLDQQIIGFIALLYLIIQRSVVELSHFKQFLITSSNFLFTQCSMPSRKLKNILLKYVIFLTSYLSNSEDIGGRGLQVSIIDCLNEEMRIFSDNLSVLYTHHVLLIRLVYCVNEACLVAMRLPFFRLWLIDSRHLTEQEASERADILITLIIASSYLAADLMRLCQEFESETRTGLFILTRRLLILTAQVPNERFLRKIISSLEYNLTKPRNESLEEKAISQLLELLILAYHIHFRYTTMSIKLSYQLINLVLNDKCDSRTISNAITLINSMVKVESKIGERQVLTLIIGHQDFLKVSFKKYFNKESFVFQQCAFLVSTLIKQCNVTNLLFPIEIEFENLINILLTNNRYVRSGALNVAARIFETKQLCLLQEFKKEKYILAPSENLRKSLSGFVFLLYNLMIDTDASTQENATSCLAFLIDCVYSFNWGDKTVKELFRNKWNRFLLETLFLGLDDISVVVITFYCKKLITKVYRQDPTDKCALYNQVFKRFTTAKLYQLSSLAFYEFFRESIPQLEAPFVRDTLDTICSTFEETKKNVKSDNDNDTQISEINNDQKMPLTTALSLKEGGIEITALRMNL